MTDRQSPVQRVEVIGDGTRQLSVRVDGIPLPARLVDVRLGLGLIPDVAIELLVPQLKTELFGPRLMVHAPELRFVCPECGHHGVHAEVRTNGSAR